MKNIISIVLVLTFVATPLLFAKRYRDKGASGEIALSYKDESFNTDGAKNTQQNFTQEYRGRYEGNLYNPKLLSYDLGGTLRYEDIKLANGNLSGKTNVKSTDYTLNIDFLSASKIPFKIYTSSSDRPTSTIFEDNKIAFVEKSSKNGFSGLVNLGKFRIDYDAFNESNDRSDLDGFMKNKVTTYKSNFKYKTKKNNAQLVLQHNVRDVVVHNFDTNDTISEGTSHIVDNTIGITSSHDLPKSLRLSNYVNYNQTDLSETKTFNANTSLSWIPKNTKYEASLYAGYDTVEYTVDQLDINGSTLVNKLNAMLLRENFLYRPFKEWSMSQGVNYNQYDSKTASGDSIGLNVNTYYNKTLTPQRELSLSANADVTQFNSEDIDQNGTIVKDDELLVTYQASLNYNERFPRLHSFVQFSARYNGRSNSNNKSVNNYTGTISINSNYKVVSNSLSGSYSLSVTSGTADDGESLDSESTSLNVSDRIGYNTQVGYRGKFSLNLGGRLESTTSKDITTDLVFVTTDTVFSYRLFRRTSFILSGDAEKELESTQLTLNSEATLRYNAGRTEMSLAYLYTQNSSDLKRSSRALLEARLSRKF